MSTPRIVILIFCIVALLFTLFMNQRNAWLSDELRTMVFRGDMFLYDQLPSYNYMLLHFWVWDINKFLK